jgi:integrase
MSVRRQRTTGSWIVDYVDQAGRRHTKSFEKKRDADQYHSTVNVDVRRGLHVPDSQSVFVAEAARLWLQTTASLERSTRAQYTQHVNLHIIPLLGAVKLSHLTLATVRGFEDKLAKDRSPAMVRKIITSLGSILADAQERGLVAQNVVRGLRMTRRGKNASQRRKGKLKVGVDIPSPAEIRTLVAALDRHPAWRPILLTAILTGLRASELRGLRWADLDLRLGELHVRQRADRYGKIGTPKSDAGERTIPLAPMLINVLRTWKLACPKGEFGLVFPSEDGSVLDYFNLMARGVRPILVAAGIVTKDGKAKYGLHSLRHFYASWCINRRADGGLELPLKLVSSRLGHASITITADRYGHLFPSTDDGAELAAAEKALVLRSV